MQTQPLNHVRVTRRPLSRSFLDDESFVVETTLLDDLLNDGTPLAERLHDELFEVVEPFAIHDQIVSFRRLDYHESHGTVMDSVLDGPGMRWHADGPN